VFFLFLDANQGLYIYPTVNLGMRILLNYKVLVVLFVLQACTNNTDMVSPTYQTSLPIRINYFVDGNELCFDSVMYQNTAGNKYSVTRLQYYISNIVLTTVSHTKVNLSAHYFIDARNKPNIIVLNQVPPNTYTGIAFDIGLGPDLNKHNKLPSTDENLSMIWPDVMGGGFHFIKLEGHYQTPSSGLQGYAMHVGLNYFLIHHQNIPINCSVASTDVDTLNLGMNVNEWYKNPYNYNFYTDGNYTMGDTTTMLHIADNGKDVFYEN
jgi:hypothetical protein